MITEDYCSFEIAKLLKEKGFEGKCTAMYDKSGCLVPTNFKRITNSEKRTFVLDTPTHQMAMAWLREEKNIIVNVWYNGVDYATEYFEPNTQTGVGKFVFIGDGYYAYEDAVEAALKYCLKNLI